MSADATEDISVRVILHRDHGRQLLFLLARQPDTNLGQILRDVLARECLVGDHTTWGLRFAGRDSEWDQSLRDLARPYGGMGLLDYMPLEIVYQRKNDRRPPENDVPRSPAEDDGTVDDGLDKPPLPDDGLRKPEGGAPAIFLAQTEKIPGESKKGQVPKPSLIRDNLPPSVPPAVPPDVPARAKPPENLPPGSWRDQGRSKSSPNRSRRGDLSKSGRGVLQTTASLRASVILRRPEECGAAYGDGRGTMRFYARMAMHRFYPLKISISQAALHELARVRIAELPGQVFELAIGRDVEVMAVIPGCRCFPSRELLPVTAEPTEATFWVLPEVFGPVQNAALVVRQGANVLAEVPLQLRVTDQRAATTFAVLAAVLPLVGVLLRKLYLGPLVADSFSVYARVLDWLTAVSPEALGGALGLLALIFYLRHRPYRRDACWDAVSPDRTRSPRG